MQVVSKTQGKLLFSFCLLITFTILQKYLKRRTSTQDRILYIANFVENLQIMIKSMTGYGKAQFAVDSRNVTVEVKSLNSKQADINVRLPYIYREKELEMRSIVTQRLERGKIDLNINVEHAGNFSNYTINAELAIRYKQELVKLSEMLEQEPPSDILSVIIKLPDVFKNSAEEVSETEWAQLSGCLNEAMNQLEVFRVQEGKILETDAVARINLILSYLTQIEPLENERITLIREKMRKDLATFASENRIDENRFEQELIYWFEKIDITEEKVRLRKHCTSFLQTIANEQAQGKKLGFITQEIGREINTIGSKANHAGIQTIVVNMKDELEKIKEQLLNIL
jgi:uncharacterized protein (TIGR00255 family)